MVSLGDTAISLHILHRGGWSGTKFQFWAQNLPSHFLYAFASQDSLSHTTYVETNNGIQLPIEALLTHCDKFVKFVKLSQKISLFI